jgi:proteic killer suppression protein
VICSFRNADTERLFSGVRVKKFESVERVALRKLVHLNQARSLQDVGAIPGSRLELLRGDREGQFSMRINGQFRICFEWKDGDAYGVEITDYH